MPVALSLVALVASLACGSPGSSSSGQGGGGNGGAPASGTGGGSLFDGGVTDAACDDAAPADAGTGCTGSEPPVSYAMDIAPIMAGCTAELCHLAPTYATLVGRPSVECCDGRLIVEPGNAARSYLVDKLTAHDLCAGGPMPLGGTPLDATKIDQVIAWICEGAKND